MAAAEPLTWAGVPKAGWTYYLGSSYGFAKLVGGSRALRLAVGVLAGVAVIAVAVLGTLAAVIAVAVFMGVVVPAFGLLAAYVIIIARLVLPASVIWTTPDRSVVLAARRVGPRSIRAAEFTAWPVGQHRTGPFLTELLHQIDVDQVVVTATAANPTLYRSLYAGYGFIITSPGARPKIRRDPKPVPARAPGYIDHPDAEHGSSSG